MDAVVNNRAPAAQARFAIDDDSKVGEARRAAQALASFELDSQTAGKVAIAATELANNLLRHAGGGDLLLQALHSSAGPQIELLALDRGPGMNDVERCMTDGFSTAGTPGTGLGAVRRLASEFDIHSSAGEGTVVLARFGAHAPVRYGAVSVAMPGEVDCGDGWRLATTRDATALMVVDGLGHGAFAAEAAHAGIEAFDADPFGAPQEILVRANASMSRTRGGAAAIARIAHDGALSYAGLGNISGTLVSPGRSQGLISQNGTVGLGQRRAQQMEYRRDTGSWLVMHSDGISARWNLRERPELFARHPAILAGLIYRDHGRGRDDATVVVLA